MRYVFLRFPNGKAKAVTFSYDDNYIQNIKLSEIISSYGIKCTFNLNSAQINGQLKKADVEQYILSVGHEIAVHGYRHRALGTLRPIEGIQEILDCRIELEQRYGRIIRGVAYADTGVSIFANNATYDSIKRYLSDLGIAYARTLNGDNDSFMLPNDWFAWMPTAHHTNPKTMEFIEKFLQLDLSSKTYCAKRAPRLFYLWGHSYEFEYNHNWDYLEAICKTIGRRDEIWYATNIEIYDYVSAWNSLIYSADNTIVFNPTLHKIWFDVDGKLYTILPGQTLIIS